MRVADPEDLRALASRLPDDPFHLNARCLLLRGLADAWTSESATDPGIVVVRSPWEPKEPMLFGDRADEAWPVLREIDGWTCVNCAADIADTVARCIERETGWATRRLADVYYTLEGPGRPHENPYVRLLGEEDLELVQAAPPVLHPTGFESLLAAVEGGLVAGAILDQNLVSTVSMTASSEEFANLAAFTLEGYRGRGFATAGTGQVVRGLVARGLVPVWSAGEDNRASAAVARRLGFEEAGRKAYVIVPELEHRGGFSGAR
jgi:hypothetical protein